jgi:hypothetical protein
VQRDGAFGERTISHIVILAERMRARIAPIPPPQDRYVDGRCDRYREETGSVPSSCGRQDYGRNVRGLWPRTTNQRR